MSVTSAIVSCGFLSNIHINPLKTPLLLLNSSLNHKDLALFSRNKCFANIQRTHKKDQLSRRSFVVYSFVQPGSPPPSEPPSNLINWILGVVLTVVLPFFSHKLVSLLKIKNEVETVVESIEGIVDAVEKVAEEVEKVAEDIGDDLPEGGRLRRAVDFIENVAERTSKDSQLVGEFIDKVQEVDEKIEDLIESLNNEDIHHNPKEDDNKAHKSPKEAIIIHETSEEASEKTNEPPKEEDLKNEKH